MARPEGLVELKAFLEAFWDDRLARTQTRSGTRGRGARMESTTERMRCVVNRDRRAAPRRSGEFLVEPELAQRWWGASVAARRAARRGLPRRGDPGQRDPRRVSRARPAPPARLHLRLGGRARGPGGPVAARVDRRRDRPRRPPRAAPRCASCIAASRAAPRPSRTRRAGSTTSGGSPWPPPAVIRDPTRGVRVTADGQIGDGAPCGRARRLR